MMSQISKYSDIGSPVVMTLPDEHTINKIYKTLALNVSEEIDLLSKTSESPHVRYETGTQNVIIRTPDGKEKKIKSHVLRKKCGCAACKISPITQRHRRIHRGQTLKRRQNRPQRLPPQNRAKRKLRRRHRLVRRAPFLRLPLLKTSLHRNP